MSKFDKPTEITVEQAISILPDGEDVHTFVNPAAGVMVGADWRRDDVIDAIQKTDHIQLTGSMARIMGHGFAINNGDRILFIQTDEERINALEHSLSEVA